MMKLFIVAHVPDDLLTAFVQHIRDFDTATNGCHFEIGIDGPDMPLAQMVTMLRMNPELTFQQIFERAKK